MTKADKAIYDKKLAAVMKEWKDGTLNSGGNGKPVKTQAQALAIAINQALKAVEDSKKKK